MTGRTDRKYIFWLVLFLVLAIIGPCVINESYKYGLMMDDPLITTVLKAEDVLSYYGTILSAFISIIILRITILHEREQITVERLLDKQNIEIDKGKNVFDALIEAIDIELEKHIFDFSIESIRADRDLGFIRDNEDIECFDIRRKLVECEKVLRVFKSLSLNADELQTIVADLGVLSIRMTVLKRISADLRTPVNHSTQPWNVTERFSECSHYAETVRELRNILAIISQKTENSFERLQSEFEH